MGLARAAIAALRLGVFEALAEGSRTADELAGAIGCDLTATTTLLDALNGFGFLTRRARRFGLARQTRRWLLAASPGSVREISLFVGDLWSAVEPVEAAIRTGRVTNFHHRDAPPDAWRNYIRGLASFARLLGGQLARKLPVDRPPARLLDVAGGHGMYSAAMCRRFPKLACEVLDLPQACLHGRELVREEGLEERILFREGDLRTAAWGTGYDVVLLFNILHNLAEAECAAAIAKARAALRPGGTLLVVDSEHGAGDGEISATAGANELFFFLVSGAQAWPERTIRAWMTTAGFEAPRRMRTLTLPNLAVLAARAPATSS